MTEEVNSSQLKAIQSEVVEFNVGVSHLALDEERERYTRIRERIESIIGSLCKNKSVQGKSDLENAQKLLAIATGNTVTLRYLESISCLESIFTDVTKAATVTAVGLSSEESIPEQVLASRFLTENVKQCWEYAAQLSKLTAAHLESAADFHIFNHEINEVLAQATQLKNASAIQLKAFSPDGRIMEATSLSAEMNERLNAFQALADRARTFASRAPSILPIENRLIEVREGVAKNRENGGPLMVQMLIDYVGSNFTVRKDDSLPLLDTTENPYLWKVMTQSGPQYIPSIACIIASADGEQVHDAYRALATVKDAWNDSLKNYRRQLATYYCKYLQSVIGGRNLHVTDCHAKARFLKDLDRLLVQPGADEGRLANILETIANISVPRSKQANEVWNRTDLNILHQPLLVLYEHIKALQRIDENVDSFTARMKEYATEGRGLQAQLESLRLTYDRNRVELKQLYDRIRNWRSVYRDSLDEPPSGIGRLVVSSVSSSSGISSEEIPVIPLPPSPFGRITPTKSSLAEVDSDESIREFLETKPQKRSKKKPVILSVKDEPHESKVFACGAVQNIRQMEAKANVKQIDIEKPKVIRDVATNTTNRRAIKNTQTEMGGVTQSERSRVDCMTQIGWIKVQKAQQVDGPIILAALEVSEPTPSCASATEGACPERVQNIFTTGSQKGQKRDTMFQVNESRPSSGMQIGNLNRTSEAFGTKPQSVDSTVFEAHVPTEITDFEAKKKTREIITQIDQITERPITVNQPDPMRSIDIASKMKWKKAALQVEPQELLYGSAELKRTLSNTRLQTEFGRASIQLETINQSLKSFDAEAQIFYAPKVSGIFNVRKEQRSSSQQTVKRGNVPYCEVSANDRSLSAMTLHTDGPEMIEMEVVNGRRPKVAAACTCLKTSPKQVQTKNSLTPHSFSCALHDPVSFHFNTPCYANCETPRIQINVDCGKKRPVLTTETDLDHMKLKIANKLYDTSVKTSTRTRTRETAFKGPQIWTQEMDSKVGQEENYTMTGTPSITQAELAVTLNNNRRLRETVNQTTCPICNCQLETHWPSTAITEASTTRNSLVTKSTQVGTVLEPIKVQVIGVTSKTRAPPEVQNFGMEVQNILCPSTVELVSSLTEASSIKVKDICDVDAVNISKGESTFYANVSERTAGATCGPDARVQQGNVDCRWIGTLLNGTSTAVKKADVANTTDKLIMQQAKFEIICSKTNEICEVCKGTGKRLIGSLEASNTRTMSTSSTIYQPLTHQEITSPAKVSAECQVGTILRPTRVYLANVEIKARTPELARQMGITPNAIIYPSTVELQTELAEHGGIQVMDVRDATNMEFVTGKALCEASFSARSSNERKQCIPGSRPFMKNTNIVCGKLGLTIGQAEDRKAAADAAQNTETFTLQDVGCEFAIKNTSIGTVCGRCLGTGRVEHSVTTFSSDCSTSVDLSRKPSFIHQRASTPLSKAAECQVGVILHPTAIQVVNIGVKPKNRTIAEYLGNNVDSVLCPAKVQMISELRETTGIKMMNVADTSCVEVQAGEVVMDADVQTYQSRIFSASIDSQKKPCLLLNLEGNPNALTIGRSSAHVPVKLTSTMRESFTLSDIGCEIVLRDTDVGRICVSCQGTGRMTSESIKSLPRPFATANLETSQQYSSLVPATMANKPILTESKLCQVGTILTPTSIKVASVKMLPKSTISASTVYPASVELESKLAETSGFQIKEVANMEIAGVSLGQKFTASMQQTKPFPETYVLEVKSCRPETVCELSAYGTAGGFATQYEKLNLQNVGFELRPKEASLSITTSKHPHQLASISETRIPSETRLRTSVPQRKHASNQVGLSLIPKTVQIADMSVNVSDKLVASSLGLKADAVICPSTIDLEMKLTETAGITVTDVKDVKEVAIKVGGNKHIISITGRNMKAFEADAVSLTFINNKPTTHQNIRQPFTKVHETTTYSVNKAFDQRARCTFQVRQTSETSFQLQPSQDAKKSDVSCQVGVLMVPETLKVSPVKVVIEEKASADTLGVSILSALQTSTCELEPRISERTGINIAQMNALKQIQLQLGGRVYTASVVNGTRKSTHVTTSGTWGYPTTETAVPSPFRCGETSVSNIIGPYLLTLKERATEDQSIVIVAGLTLGAESLQFRVDDDLRGKLTMQTCTKSDRRFTGHLNFSQGLTSTSEHSIPRRPDSSLCDVACEALIKPETLEKRIQTFFM